MLTPLQHALLYASVQQAISALPAGGASVIERYHDTAWVVGGFVRDTLVRLLHGRPVVPKDLDVLVAQIGNTDGMHHELTALGHTTTLGSKGSCRVDGVDCWFVGDYGKPLGEAIDQQRKVIGLHLATFPLTCQRLAIHVATGTLCYDMIDTTADDVQQQRLSLGHHGNLHPGLWVKLPRLIEQGWVLSESMIARMQKYPEHWAPLVAAVPSLALLPPLKSSMMLQWPMAFKKFEDQALTLPKTEAFGGWENWTICGITDSF